MWRLVITLLATSVAVSMVYAGEVTFNIAGGWPYPYHGNPFLAGGIGVAWWLSNEPFAYYVPGSGEWIPRLAEEWEAFGNVLKVKIRDDAKWSNGEDVTADDIITGYYLTKAMWNNWDFVHTVGKVDDKTVLFVTKKEIAPPQKLRILTNVAFSLTPKSLYGKFLDKAKEVAKIRDEIFSYTSEGKKVPDELNKRLSEKLGALRDELQKFKPWEEYEKLVCDGAYVPTKIRQDVMILEKNPYHFLAETNLVPKIIVYRWSSNEACWAMLMQGKLDGNHAASTKEVAEQIMKTNPKIKLALPSDLGEFSVAFNLRKKLFQDINLRKAMIYALDRKKVREICYPYGADVDVYAHGVLKTFEKTWLSDDLLSKLTKYAYNPQTAEIILISAGYTKGPDGFWRTPDGKLIEFKIAAPAAWSDFVMAAKEIAEQYKKFGFKAEAELIPNEVFSTRLRGGEYDTAIVFGVAWWGAGEPWAGYDRIYGENGFIANITKFPADKNYETPWGLLNPRKLARELIYQTDRRKAKEIVEKLAYITNENIIFISFLEKRIMIYH
ncbi:MAG TPA: ABC transporter substrate-binding protein, partial [Thermotoga sp.]|nr:ABC transporter substrate-binding protein [Thermotoga sp.]